MARKIHLAQRMDDIQPFHVMDILARARQLEAEGRSIVHLEIGEPDFATAETIIQAGQLALQNRHTHYTPTLGLPALRQAIADDYQRRFSIQVPASRIVITPGASGALHLALAVLVNPGEEVLMADPGYPCNRHFVRLLEGQSRNIAVTEATDYQLTAALLDHNWSDNSVAAMLASPSNPTGTLVTGPQMQAMIEVVDARGGRLLVDEIYQGLSYGVDEFSCLQLTDQAFVINSFSKYYGMTGWRLGWLVVPEAYVDAVDRLAQNIFLAAPTLSQHAALAAFSDDTRLILDQRRDEFRRRRDYLLPELKAMGFEIPVTPQGAFYIYANSSRFSQDSHVFVNQLLEQAGVAVTPGIDFGAFNAQQYVRFAYTRPIEVLEEGVKRIREFIKNC
ncbi:MAG: pyridoxal phosphate-dependent aminotransferase [Gammaproteobacteria bacterium]|nr:pyridoxal phosphate-dependent aminotransferase [Gammaproteobacteria bacterium]